MLGIKRRSATCKTSPLPEERPFRAGGKYLWFSDKTQVQLQHCENVKLLEGVFNLLNIHLNIYLQYGLWCGDGLSTLVQQPAHRECRNKSH